MLSTTITGEGMDAKEQQLQIHNGEQLSSACLSESLCEPGSSTAVCPLFEAGSAASLHGMKFSANKSIVRNIAVTFIE